MKERLIKAEALKNYCRSRRNRNTADLRSQTLKTFALQLVEDFCKDVDRQKPVEAIPGPASRQAAIDVVEEMQAPIMRTT